MSFRLYQEILWVCHTLVTKFVSLTYLVFFGFPPPPGEEHKPHVSWKKNPLPSIAEPHFNLETLNISFFIPSFEYDQSVSKTGLVSGGGGGREGRDKKASYSRLVSMSVRNLERFMNWLHLQKQKRIQGEESQRLPPQWNN